MNLSRVLPRLGAVPEITTYDLVKTLAIILMLVDHVGYFFYPEETWFRVIGRGCLPIWFFLIGYAQSRDLGPSLWIGAVVVGIANMTLGGSVFPLNVLFTMIAIRLVIDAVAEKLFSHWFWLIAGSALLCVAYFPSAMALEYGTSGLLLALFGYAIRHEGELRVPNWLLYVFCAFTLIFFALSQNFLFSSSDPNFGEAQSLATLGIVGVTGLMMTCFQPLILPRLSAATPGFLTAILQIGGRYTMEIYVIHLILFRLISVVAGLPGHEFLKLQWIY